MPKRFLNVEYGTISTEIDVTDFEDLSDVQDAIKSEYDPAMADIDAPQLQLYTNSVSPPPSRQPTQTDLGPTSAAASPALLDFWTAFTNYPNPLEGNTVVQLPADPNLLFQMTGAKDHPCKQTELCDVLEILGNPSKPELYFVVPPDRFACFTRQSYHGTDGRVLSQNDTIASVEKLNRFVLTFETSHQ
ncbi:hypothetical protein BATDEDRAFT_28175 [Batrachochytrium dendrobatidis JAM81]|uniref:Uncharacterized protein n=1 Tax=Batrachochytrium dendrobatidis (strain JAM81 / FGSC 10211) TaxID=684364 RepID=F4PD67_BATDJ|nr:uncharacterized protein BATDEDRAFT_28175 [Batrachochytrium dendrobatidis JAM81]EGF76734.1 hypothetical protein BATDEDRAFT_28175 [Batrachochytrium dendrobatidis JAM81]|eukprot:XP_006682577.1 hypothetical protein BATDEDRAFT_28175 [Batrachochytrium dendrobatidis JAM81]